MSLVAQTASISVNRGKAVLQALDHVLSKPVLNCLESFSLSPKQEHEQLSYSSTRTKAPSVIISGLKPATWYVFSVRTRTPAGYSSYTPKYEYKTTGDCKYLKPSETSVLSFFEHVYWHLFHS